eukprot:171196_1
MLILCAVCFLLAESVEICTKQDADTDEALAYAAIIFNLGWAVFGMVTFPATAIVSASVVSGMMGIGATGISVIQMMNEQNCVDALYIKLVESLVIDTIKQTELVKLQTQINILKTAVKLNLIRCRGDDFTTASCLDGLDSALEELYDDGKKILEPFMNTQTKLDAVFIIELAEVANYNKLIYDIYEYRRAISTECDKCESFEDIRTKYMTTIKTVYLVSFYDYYPELIKVLMNSATGAVTTPEKKSQVLEIWYKQINFCGWVSEYQRISKQMGLTAADHSTKINNILNTDPCINNIFGRTELKDLTIHSKPIWETGDDWSETFDGLDKVWGFKHYYESFQCYDVGIFSMDCDNFATVALGMFIGDDRRANVEKIIKRDDSFEEHDETDQDACSINAYISGYRQFGFNETANAYPEEIGNIGFEFVCREKDNWQKTEVITSDYDYLPNKFYVHAGSFNQEVEGEQAWTPWHECPPGQFLTGIKGNIDEWSIGEDSDDGALEDVQFTCGAYSDSSFPGEEWDEKSQNNCQRYLWCAMSECPQKESCQKAYLDGDEDSINLCASCSDAKYSCWGYDHPLSIKRDELDIVCHVCDGKYVCKEPLPGFPHLEICVGTSVTAVLNARLEYRE